MSRVTVEKPNHTGSAVDATPGYGGYCDYWLVTVDGRAAWKLVDLPSDRDHATTHAAFSPDGTKFAWTLRRPVAIRPDCSAWIHGSPGKYVSLQVTS